MARTLLKRHTSATAVANNLSVWTLTLNMQRFLLKHAQTIEHSYTVRGSAWMQSKYTA
jgi:hypothetical protein